MPTPDVLDVPRLLAESFLLDAEHHDEIDSTQDRAHQLAAAGARGPLLIVADRQTDGRGRGSNRWWTGPGSLAFSLLFEPQLWGLSSGPVPLRSLAAGVALVDAVAPLVYPHNVGLHWPNDVFVGSAKLAGILIEVLADGRHILGMGLNVNNSIAAAPADVRRRATSLVDLTGMPHDRTDVLLAILSATVDTMNQLSADAALVGHRFQDLCLQVGQPLVLESGNQRTSGRCLGIAPDGALILETARGSETFYSGVLVHGD